MLKPVGIAILVALAPIQSFGVLYLLRLYRKHVRFLNDAKVADGVVIGTRKFSGGEGPDYWARVVYTVAGTEYMLKDGIWSGRRYKKGQVVKIYYLPEAPGEGRIAQPSLPFVLLIGAFLIATTVVIALWALWKELSA